MKKNIVLKKAKKSTYGITLIALVVTIVILIILATISINLLIKAGGIISKAKESAVINNINQKKESVQMVIATKTIEKLSGEKKIASVEEVLGEIQKSENSTAIYAMKDNKVITATEGTTKFGASFLFPKETTGINTGIRIDVDDKLNITNAVKAEVEEATKEESAGVYDSEGNLIASWDRLKEEYNLNIENSYDPNTSKTNNSDGNSMYYVLNQDEFKEKTGLKIIIPSSVTSIGEYAFSGCGKLINTKIPEGVTNIGERAFDHCSSLTSIEIAESVTSIGDYAFYYCRSLTNIKIPKGVESINRGTFWYCDSLTNITLPEGVTSIEGIAFLGCTSLTRIDIPSSVTSIGEYAFSNCQSLTNITIPSSVTTIEEYTFQNCSSLDIKVPSTVETIEDESAFEGCKSVTYENEKGRDKYFGN